MCEKRHRTKIKQLNENWADKRNWIKKKNINLWKKNEWMNKLKEKIINTKKTKN